MIQEQPDLKVTGAFGDCTKALKFVRQSPPNIVLLDLGLRNQNSLNIAKQLKSEFQKVKVIMMDLVPSQEDLLIFVQEGVAGFILKEATVDDFLKTIRTVAGGAKALPSNLTGSLFSPDC